MPGYIAVADLTEATTTVLSPPGAPFLDFTQFSPFQLQSLINRAANQIDGYCRQTFQLTNVLERYTGRGTNRMFLRKFPLAQITDSVFGIGAFGSISQSLVCDTTFTAAITSGQITAGINQVSVADISNMLPGQYLQWGDGTAEVGQEITAVVSSTVTPPIPVTGPGTLTLKNNLAIAHPLPPANAFAARIVVNTLDLVSIVLPGQALFPIPLTQLVVDAQKGEIINYTPLMFQNLGYATIFPAMLPLLVRYTFGFPLGQIPGVLQEVNIEQCRRIALRNMDLSVGGISSIRSGDATINYAAWKPVPFGEDLQDYLGPFRRNLGIK